MRIKELRFWLALAAAALITASCAPAASAPEAATLPAATLELVAPTETPTAEPTIAPTEAPTAKPTAAENAGMPTPTLAPDLPQSAKAIQRISAEELKALLDGRADLAVVDTRSKDDYSDGFIPGARNLPWAEEIVGVRLLPKDKLLVLYGADPDDESAAGVAMQLIEKHGFTQVILLEGGLQRWLDELGYPYETSLGY